MLYGFTYTTVWVIYDSLSITASYFVNENLYSVKKNDEQRSSENGLHSKRKISSTKKRLKVPKWTKKNPNSYWAVRNPLMNLDF